MQNMHLEILHTSSQSEIHCVPRKMWLRLW